MDGTCHSLTRIPMGPPSRGHYTSDCPILILLRPEKLREMQIRRGTLVEVSRLWMLRLKSCGLPRLLRSGDEASTDVPAAKEAHELALVVDAIDRGLANALGIVD
jgi:hypothetical protein